METTCPHIVVEIGRLYSKFWATARYQLWIVEISTFHTKTIKRNFWDEVTMRGAVQPPKLLMTDGRKNELLLLKE